MKIAIFPSYGGGSVPKQFRKAIEDSKLHWRSALAEEISKLAINIKAGYQERYDEFEKSKYLKYNENAIFFATEDIIKPIEIEIVEIDISKPWRIVEYDGAEGIEYFEGVKVLDKDINRCEW